MTRYISYSSTRLLRLDIESCARALRAMAPFHSGWRNWRRTRITKCSLLAISFNSYVEANSDCDCNLCPWHKYLLVQMNYVRGFNLTWWKSTTGNGQKGFAGLDWVEKRGHVLLDSADQIDLSAPAFYTLFLGIDSLFSLTIFILPSTSYRIYSASFGTQYLFERKVDSLHCEASPSRVACRYPALFCVFMPRHAMACVNMMSIRSNNPAAKYCAIEHENASYW